jgi:hypothetical protein
MKSTARIAPWMLGIGLLGWPAFAQDSKSCHHTAVDERGDHVMGFEHEKTSHHFRLTPSGGAIEVSANDPGDTASRDAIRMHLAHIAKKFSEGDFEAPMLIHDRVAPGVPVMEKNKDRIRWTYEDTDAGGRIVVATGVAECVSAIHDFLRFQIEDHRTGDSLDVTRTETTR